MSINLSEVLRQWRWAARTDLKTAAAEIGISDSTLASFERGNSVSGDTLIRILAWLLAPPDDGPEKPGQLMLEDRSENRT